jgi:hypothetical protein
MFLSINTRSEFVEMISILYIYTVEYTNKALFCFIYLKIEHIY